ncbi:hypothetical protein V9K97_10475 [Variovorax sp. CCNWLW186]|uniref:hypothetical protein n=1 Tax=Variovorax sp. CCNWLW186 TaxID=3127473 RepID=UPI003077CA45
MAQSVLQLTQTPAFKRRLEARFAKIAAERDRLGLPKAVIVDEVVYRQFPDESVERVDVQKAPHEAKDRDPG